MYKLVIFDLDGTLMPQRKGSCGQWEPALMPNVACRVDALRLNGVKIGIASNQSKRRDVQDIIAQVAWITQILDLDCDLVKWSTKDSSKKPSPYMLNAVMCEAQACPESTLFVGDQDTDKQAAKNAGCDFMWASDFFEWSA